jgi:site-specific recombinase XerD
MKIDFDDMAGYKKHRLSQKKKNGKPIKLATVHRELSKARRMFNIAIGKKWLYANPFKNESDEKLIQIAAERPKTTVLSDAEEARLLKAFQNGDTRCRSSLQPSTPVSVVVHSLTSCVGNTLILRMSRLW